jgi:hypothetical protein
MLRAGLPEKPRCHFYRRFSQTIGEEGADAIQTKRGTSGKNSQNSIDYALYYIILMLYCMCIYIPYWICRYFGVLCINGFLSECISSEISCMQSTSQYVCRGSQRQRSKHLPIPPEFSCVTTSLSKTSQTAQAEMQLSISPQQICRFHRKIRCLANRCLTESPYDK